MEWMAGDGLKPTEQGLLRRWDRRNQRKMERAADTLADFRQVTDLGGRTVTIEVVRTWEPLGHWDELSLVDGPLAWLRARLAGRTGYAAVGHVPRRFLAVMPRVLERRDGLSQDAARAEAAAMAERLSQSRG